MSVSLDLEGIILILIFIAPGFYFTRTYLAFRPRYFRAPTTFEQTVLSIVGSVLIHGTLSVAIAIGILVHWLLTGQLLQIRSLTGPLMPLEQYPLGILAIFFIVAVVYVGASLVLARRAASALGRRSPVTLPRWWLVTLGEDPPERLALWHTMLQDEPLRLGLLPPHLTIRMRNGDRFEGDLERLRLVGDEDNTIELAIRNVSYRPADSQPGQVVDALLNQVVLLRSTDILWLGRSDLRREKIGIN